MNLKKLFLYFLISIIFFPYCSYALEYEKGDIRNPVLTVAEDGVSVTKKVSKTDDPMTYNVEFSIEGEIVVEPILNDLYVSVIFDRSGSMLCADGTNTFLFLGYLKKTTINNQNLYCMYDNTIEIEKWNSAVNGAIDFSKYIVENISTAKINLYTFADDVTSSEWSTEIFEENDFGYPNGATNLHLAIDEAKSNLDLVNSNAMKYILIISDGEPDDLDSLRTSIKNVKDAGIKVYVIGYDVDAEAKEILEEISSGDSYYYDADISKIGVILKDLAHSIEDKPLGVDAVLKDTLGKNFTFKDGENVISNENSVIYNNFEITKEKIVFDFNILLDDNLTTGWYTTNDVSNNGVILEYKDVLGNIKKLAFDTSSEVYWEEEQYLYTINYYKDFIDEGNFLGKVEGYEKLDNVISNSDIEIDKYIIPGYNSSNVLVPDYVIKKENNVINIVYTKNLYPYHVEYYKDEISRVN